MSAPDLTPVRQAVTAWLTDRLNIPVYTAVTPAGVDTTRPWIVLHWIPGGGPTGSPIRRGDMWDITLAVTAVAQSPTGTAPGDAVRTAASDAADQTRQVLADQADRITATGGLEVVARELLAQGGIDAEGPTVNIADQWRLTVH